MGLKKSKEKIGLSGMMAALVLTILIISGSVCLVLNLRILYYADIKLMKLPEVSGMEYSAIRENYDALIDYNMIWNRGDLFFPSLPMSPSGRIHFGEVKKIFDGIQIVFILSIIPAIWLGLWMAVRRRRRWLKITGLLCLGLPLAALCAVWIDWENFFITFHKLVFRNDYWWFDPATDPVILILPDGYFEQCAVLIVLIVLLAGVFCLMGSRKRG